MVGSWIASTRCVRMSPTTVKRWLARLAWSFCIIGFWLLYDAHLINGRAGPVGQVLLLVVGGAMALAMGAAGIRARHTRDPDE